jgi:hypothetical protein
MPAPIRLLLKLPLVAALLLGSATQAVNYSLWIKGRGSGGVPGRYGDFAYWGPSSVAAGINKRAVNWDGHGRIAAQNYRVRDALDCFCTGPNWCYVAAYSAGDLMIGYALDLYGGTARYKTNPNTALDGKCSNSDGSTQVGWNIKWVDVAAGAAGGTELADAGAWALSEPLVADLKVATARAMYNHDNTRGRMFYLFAGARGGASSALLPGQDDGVIAYHSSGGVSGSSGHTYCNPGDLWCKDLTLGTALTEGGRRKWLNHSVRFRDDGEDYGHALKDNWSGIVSRMRLDMQSHATP